MKFKNNEIGSEKADGDGDDENAEQSNAFFSERKIATQNEINDKLDILMAKGNSAENEDLSFA